MNATETARDTASLHAVDSLLADILRGGRLDTAALARLDPGRFVTAALNHDVLPLVAERLAGRDDVPEALRARLRELSSQAVATDLLREVELRRLLAALESRAIGSLIIKGSHLAYSHYPRPDLRPRVDTDLLIQGRHRDELHEILTIELGYEAISKVSGDFVAAQRLYIKYHDGAIVHAVDVHWKVASPAVFAQVARYEEMAATAVPLPRLGSGARGPANVFALLIACVHRVAHHGDSMHFKWIYDIDVIARSLTPGDWRAFASLAAERQMTAVCQRSLERAAYWFRTDLPVGLWAASSRRRPAERSAAYLDARPKAEMVADDLRALPSWSARARLIFEHTCPSADYMRRIYAPHSRAPLVALYLLRIARGAMTWFRLSH